MPLTLPWRSTQAERHGINVTQRKSDGFVGWRWVSQSFASLLNRSDQHRSLVGRVLTRLCMTAGITKVVKHHFNHNDHSRFLAVQRRIKTRPTRSFLIRLTGSVRRLKRFLKDKPLNRLHYNPWKLIKQNEILFFIHKNLFGKNTPRAQHKQLIKIMHYFFASNLCF